MKHSTDRILTTHAGSLSRPANLIAMSKAIATGESKGDAAYAQCLASSVADVVKKQRELGVDIPDDGEFGKPVAGSYDYGAWWNYAFARMSGFSPAGSLAAAAHETQHKKSSVADLALTSFANRRDWQKFGEFYQDPESSGSLMGSAARRPVGRPACTGPIKYTGHAALQADIENLKKALAATGAEEGFMCSIGPGSFARGVDLYYKTEEEFLFASADAMRDEYKAIVDAGIVLQIDDPSLPDNWDMINPEPPLKEFKKFEAGAHGGAQSCAARIAARTASASIFAGAAGTARTPPTFRCKTSSTWCSASTPAPIRWKPAMSATSTNGGCGRTPNCPMASCSFPASSATPPTSSSIRRSSPTASCATPRWSAARTSSPAPIAGWAAASIRKSPGPNCRRWPKARKLATKELWG